MAIVLQERLSTAASSADRSFQQVSSVLSGIRAGMGGLSERLAVLNSTLKGQLATFSNIDKLEQNSIKLKVAVRRASDISVSPQIQHAVSSSQALLDDTKKRVRILNAIARLTLVNARSIGTDGFDSYVEGLHDISSTVAKRAHELEASVQQLFNGRCRAKELFSQATRALDLVSENLNKAKMERVQAQATLQGLIDSISEDMSQLTTVQASETEAVIQFMQFSDNFDQRMAHIQIILNRSEPEALVLCGAQLRALREDVDQQITRILSSLNAISRAVLAASKTLSLENTSETAVAQLAVEHGKSMISSLIKGASFATDAIVVASSECTLLKERAAVAQDNLAPLTASSQEIQLSAINSVILSRKEPSQAKAFTVLASDVQAQAAFFGRAASECNNYIATMSSVEDNLIFEEVSSLAQWFTDALGEATTTDRATQGASDVVVRLRSEALTAFAEVKDSTRVSLDAVENLKHLSADLARLASALPCDLTAGTTNLEDIMDIYTMESEREVHRSLFGLAQDTSEEHVPDDLSAILF